MRSVASIQRTRMDGDNIWCISYTPIKWDDSEHTTVAPAVILSVCSGHMHIGRRGSRCRLPSHWSRDGCYWSQDSSSPWPHADRHNICSDVLWSSLCPSYVLYLGIPKGQDFHKSPSGSLMASWHSRNHRWRRDLMALHNQGPMRPYRICQIVQYRIGRVWYCCEQTSCSKYIFSKATCFQ